MSCTSRGDDTSADRVPSEPRATGVKRHLRPTVQDYQRSSVAELRTGAYDPEETLVFKILCHEAAGKTRVRTSEEGPRGSSLPRARTERYL